MITRIRIPARWSSPEGVDGGIADFTLGEGPCGKTVDKLCLFHEGRMIKVYQRHSDGTSKNFLYRLEDVTGRIEVDREP